MRRVTNTEKEISKQEGLFEGKESAIREVAIKLLKNNVDIKTISNSTGLSIEEINSLN